MTWEYEIRSAARRQKLDPKLVAAVMLVESGGNRWAWNPEPRYRWLWNVRTKAPFRALTNAEVEASSVPLDFPALAGDRDQEWQGQRASWGLMQVMGAVARELGFAGSYLTELTDPFVNLTYGCMHLAKMLEWAGGNYERALAAWNGGKMGNVSPPYRNAVYAAKVLGRVDSIVLEA